jgi:hypothetical protein
LEADAWEWVHDVEDAHGPANDVDMADARAWVAELTKPANASTS